MTRALNPFFMSALQEPAQLLPLLDRVRRDRDLMMEIREDYFNIYHKGHNVVRVSYNGGKYTAEYTPKFWKSATPSTLTPIGHVQQLLEAIPHIKDHIALHAANGNEIEFEQMLIRANNCESRISSDYYFIDRQVILDADGRFDLVGFRWPTQGRRRHQTVPLVLAEVKFGCNNDIQDLPVQLARYAQSVRQHMGRLADEAQTLLSQKIELGLLGDAHGNGDALATLRISPAFDAVRFLIILVDYNPNSELLARALKNLPSDFQIDVFFVGFGLWDAYLNKMNKITGACSCQQSVSPTATSMA
jgi:hypothetical protein